MSVVRVSQLTSEIGSGDFFVNTGNRLISTDNEIYSGPGSIVQEVRNTAMTAGALATSGGPVELGLIGTIKPRFKSSTIYVRFFSTMLYGAAGSLICTLYRQGGTYASNNWFNYDSNTFNGFNNLTADTRSSYRYAYGWNYNSNSWAPAEFKYFDFPGTTDEVSYKLYYQSSGTNYLVDQYMEYGWILTEIRGRD